MISAPVVFNDALDVDTTAATAGLTFASINNPTSKAITKTGMAVGTPQYMSPEQAAADPSVDGRSDVYALGTLLYEMLAGSVPYPGPTAHAILARKMSGPPPSLRVVRPTVPEGLERAVFKSMEIAPADRFKSAQALGAALESAITPVSLPATGSNGIMFMFTRHRKDGSSQRKYCSADALIQSLCSGFRRIRPFCFSRTTMTCCLPTTPLTSIHF